MLKMFSHKLFTRKHSSCREIKRQIPPHAVADPGCPKRGGGGGVVRQALIWDKNVLFGKIFTENCVKMKEFGPGVPTPPPPGSTNGMYSMYSLMTLPTVQSFGPFGNFDMTRDFLRTAHLVLLIRTWTFLTVYLLSVRRSCIRRHES